MLLYKLSTPLPSVIFFLAVLFSSSTPEFIPFSETGKHHYERERERGRGMEKGMEKGTERNKEREGKKRENRKRKER